MRFRITFVLMVAIGGLTALAAGAVLLVTAGASIRNTLELMRTQARLTISSVERGVVDHLEPATSIVADISGRIARSALDVTDRERLAATLSGALAPASQIGGAVVWRRDGEALWVTRRSNGNIEIEDRNGRNIPGFESFLRETVGAQGIRWGEPFYRDNATFITVAGVILRGGTYGGVVATGVSLVELSRVVRDLAEEGMTAFVLYGEDRVLAHPAMLDVQYSGLLSPEKPLLSIDEVGDPVLAQFAALPIADLPGRDDFALRETGMAGTGHIILSRTVDDLGAVPWHIGVHVPVEAVNQQMRRLAGSIILGLALLVFAVGAALVLARRIARPIRAVSAAAEKIERLDLDAIEPLPRSRIRELDEQARSFNGMVGGLRWFRAYVPQTLVRRLMRSTSGPAADVREAELTVMFTDIIGFTALSESMPVTELAATLNHHFEVLNSCIEAEAGTLDKYIGDATMAFWGAPEPIADHAARACRAALAIAEAMDADPEWRIRVKIAIHTGPLIVGNIGAPSRMNYTVVGDTVNVGARIETLASEFDNGGPATILCSGDVVAAAGTEFAFEPIGDRLVRGRTQAVEIWRLIAKR